VKGEARETEREAALSLLTASSSSYARTRALSQTRDPDHHSTVRAPERLEQRVAVDADDGHRGWREGDALLLSLSSPVPPAGVCCCCCVLQKESVGRPKVGLCGGTVVCANRTLWSRVVGACVKNRRGSGGGGDGASLAPPHPLFPSLRQAAGPLQRHLLDELLLPREVGAREVLLRQRHHQLLD